MKEKRIDLRASKADEMNIQRAAEKMGTDNLSQTILKSVELVANQEPELFICNRPNIRKIDQNIDYVLIYLQKFVDEFIKIIEQPPTLEDIQYALAGSCKLGSAAITEAAVRELVSKKLYEQARAKHPDLNITIDLLPVKDLTNLIEISNMLDSAPSISVLISGIYWNCYQISNNGKVTVIPEAVEQRKDLERAFAVSPEEKRRLAKVRELCSFLNSFLMDKELSPNQVLTTVYVDSETGRFEPSGFYIKTRVTPQININND